MAKLGELYKITSGGTPSRTHSEYYEDGTIPWVKTGDLKGKYLFETDEKISQLGLENSSARIYLKNTVLLAMYGATIGATSILKIDAATNQACAAFSPREDILPEYLYAFLESQKDRFIKDAVGGAQPNLSAGYLKNIEFNYPPLVQQTKITSTLNKIDELLLLRKQQLAKLDELVKARFVEMFGDPQENPRMWNKTVLSNLIINANNGLTRRGCDADGQIVLRLVELQNGRIDYSSPNRMVLNDNEKKKYLLSENDLLFARVNGNPENVGRCAVFHEIQEPVYHNDHIIRVHLNETVLDGKFAEVILNSLYGKRQMRQKIKTSAGQYTISQDGINELSVIAPPISIQHKFSEYVKRIDQQKQTVQRSLEKLELMKKALMQEYFG